MAILAWNGVGHSNNTAIGKRIKIIVYLFFLNVFSYFTTPYHIYWHDIGSFCKIMQRNRRDCTFNISFKSIDAMRDATDSAKERDCVTFTATNV